MIKYIIAFLKMCKLFGIQFTATSSFHLSFLVFLASDDSQKLAYPSLFHNQIKHHVMYEYI